MKLGYTMIFALSISVCLLGSLWFAQLHVPWHFYSETKTGWNVSTLFYWWHCAQVGITLGLVSGVLGSFMKKMDDL